MGINFLEGRQDAAATVTSAPAGVLDGRAARDKAAMMRKSSHERRLPASVLAKKRAAEKLKNLLNVAEEATTIANVVVDEEKFDEKSVDEKAEFLAKQMSKLESSQILQILRSLETGALGKHGISYILLYFLCCYF